MHVHYGLAPRLVQLPGRVLAEARSFSGFVLASGHNQTSTKKAFECIT